MFRGGRLIRLLQHKELVDRDLLSANRDAWYGVNSAWLDPDAVATFYPSHYCQDTEDFIQASIATSNSVCLQLYYSAFSTLLSLVLTKTSLNGLIGRGAMFLLAAGSLRNFLGMPDDWTPAEKKVLDLGAGDGSVTAAAYPPLFMYIYCTDASKVMEWRLAQRGFNVLPIDKWATGGHHTYHLISALNLLDRHHDPVGLLDQLHRLAWDSHCMVLLSMVLPLKPYVEFGPAVGRAPQRPLALRGVKFEDQVNSIIRDVLAPAGFEVVRWTKLPYLSEGDLSQAFYKLDDAVFLLRPLRRDEGAAVREGGCPPGVIQHTSASPASTKIVIHDET